MRISSHSLHFTVPRFQFIDCRVTTNTDTQTYYLIIQYNVHFINSIHKNFALASRLRIEHESVSSFSLSTFHHPIKKITLVMFLSKRRRVNWYIHVCIFATCKTLSYLKYRKQNKSPYGRHVDTSILFIIRIMAEESLPFFSRIFYLVSSMKLCKARVIAVRTKNYTIKNNKS